MKKRINLLVKQKDYLKIESYFKILRYSTFVIVAIFIVYIAFYYYLQMMQSKQLSNLLNEKNGHLNYFIQNKGVEASLMYFAKKQKNLQEFMKNDVKFLPYYKLLTDTLKYATTEAALDDINIDKKRNTEFTVSFQDYDAFRNFFEYIETDTFLDKFNTLVLKNFSTIKTQKSTYKLTFSGSFKEIDEIQN